MSRGSRSAKALPMTTFLALDGICGAARKLRRRGSDWMAIATPLMAAPHPSRLSALRASASSASA